jgi:hypothetical protein
MFGVVGHGDLTAESWGLVEAELPAVLRRLEPHGLIGVVRAAAGLPLVFGRAVHRAGGSLVVVVPTVGALPAALPEPDRVAARQLLTMAERARLVEFDPRDPVACAAVDERIIDSCRGLVAVWDGSRAEHWLDVSHLATYAHHRKVLVEVVWPTGARRIAPCTTAAVQTDGESA